MALLRGKRKNETKGRMKMYITKDEIADIPDEAFTSTDTLREVLRRRWTGVSFSENTLRRMITDRNGSVQL